MYHLTGLMKRAGLERTVTGQWGLHWAEPGLALAAAVLADWDEVADQEEMEVAATFVEKLAGKKLELKTIIIKRYKIKTSI